VSEYYEARQEAMNDFIAERAREMWGNLDGFFTEDAILELIEDGAFDDAVRKRMKVLNESQRESR